MSKMGGLPAIPVYEIERHWYLHELARLRAAKRVNGLTDHPAFKRLQKSLCETRKKHYA